MRAAGKRTTVVEALLTPASARVAALLTNAAREGGFDRGDAHFSIEEMKVDEEGWSAAAKVLSDALGEILRIHKEAAGRLKADAGLPQVSAVTLVQLFEAPHAPAERSAARSPAKRRARAGVTA